MFVALNGIFEPSAIQQLSDGRFLLVEDEKDHPFSLLTIRPDGSTLSEPVDASASRESLGKLDDLEGLAAGKNGEIYAITSHSRSSEGEEKKSREKLVRFRIEGNRVLEAQVARNLKTALSLAHPVLARAAAVLDVKGEGGFNIEALEQSPHGDHLLIGFRSPLDGDKALIATLENPAAMFDKGDRPQVTRPLLRLDLGGHGLRGMSWIPALRGYLLISGPVAKEQVQFRLWYWRGDPAEAPRPAEVDGLAGFEHAEGVTPALIAGQPKIVIVSDDGSRAEGRPARFLILDPQQIRFAP